MSKFEDRLWMELVRDHGRDLAQLRAPARRRARRPRPRLLIGTTAGLVGLGTILALLLGAASSSPAFAVARNSDGTVTVWVARVGGIAGANARLAQLGVHAKAVQMMAGCAAVRPAGVVPRKVSTFVAPAKMQRLIVKARFDPKQIPLGHTLVLSAMRAGVVARVSPAHLVRGPAPRCFPSGVPPLPPALLHDGKGQVRCMIMHAAPGFAPRDAQVAAVKAPVSGNAHITVMKIGEQRLINPKTARLKGDIRLPALAAVHAARECRAAAVTSSRASRH